MQPTPTTNPPPMAAPSLQARTARGARAEVPAGRPGFRPAVLRILQSTIDSARPARDLARSRVARAENPETRFASLKDRERQVALARKNRERAEAQYERAMKAYFDEVECAAVFIANNGNKELPLPEPRPTYRVTCSQRNTKLTVSSSPVPDDPSVPQFHTHKAIDSAGKVESQTIQVEGNRERREAFVFARGDDLHVHVHTFNASSLEQHVIASNKPQGLYVDPEAPPDHSFSLMQPVTEALITYLRRPKAPTEMNAGVALGHALARDRAARLAARREAAQSDAGEPVVRIHHGSLPS